MKKKEANINIRILNFDACNQKCLFCLKSDYIKKYKNYPSLLQIKKEIAKAKKEGCTHIDFFGGEPTLFPFLKEAVIYAQKLGMTALIATNGTNFGSAEFSEKFFSGIDDNKLWFRTTIHSSDPLRHDAITQLKGSHKLTAAGIKNILKHTEILATTVVITALNYKELKKITEFVHGLGVKGIKFSGLTLQGRLLENKKLMIDFDDYWRYLMDAVRTAEKLKFKYISVEKIPMERFREKNIKFSDKIEFIGSEPFNVY